MLSAGISKIPIAEQLGWTIAETALFSWNLSEWVARLLIGLEIFIGTLFILQLKTQKLAKPIALLLIILFSTYLFYILKKYGNESNCNCYGEWIPLSTIQSLWKNALLLSLIILSYFLSYDWTFKRNTLVVILLLLSTLLLPFFLSPPENIFIFPRKEHKAHPFKSSLIQSEDLLLAEKISHGKNIAVMLSLSCKFCKKAAKRLTKIHRRSSNIPFNFILAGHSDHLEDFLDEFDNESIPWVLVKNRERFKDLNHGQSVVPSIHWIQDSSCVKESNYINFKEKEVLKWLKE